MSETAAIADAYRQIGCETGSPPNVTVVTQHRTVRPDGLNGLHGRGPMAKRITVLLLALVVLGTLPQLPGSASADPKRKEQGSDSKHRNHPPAKRAHRDLHHVKGGPPPWAPAHGYRRKRGGGRVAYVAPFGINAGTCSRELLGAALGGSAGGLLASELASRGDRTPAIIGGTLVGV